MMLIMLTDLILEYDVVELEDIHTKGTRIVVVWVILFTCAGNLAVSLRDKFLSRNRGSDKVLQEIEEVLEAA